MVIDSGQIGFVFNCYQIMGNVLRVNTISIRILGGFAVNKSGNQVLNSMNVIVGFRKHC